MALKEEKVFVTSGEKKGQCSKGDQCGFGHESNDRAKPTPKTAPPSEPPAPKTRGGSASRKKKRQSQMPVGSSIDCSLKTS